MADLQALRRTVLENIALSCRNAVETVLFQHLEAAICWADSIVANCIEYDKQLDELKNQLLHRSSCSYTTTVDAYADCECIASLIEQHRDARDKFMNTINNWNLTFPAAIMTEVAPLSVFDTIRQAVRDESQKIRTAYKSTCTYRPFVAFTSEVFTHLSKKVDTMFTDDVFNDKMLLLEKIFNIRNLALNNVIAELAVSKTNESARIHLLEQGLKAAHERIAALEEQNRSKE